MPAIAIRHAAHVFAIAAVLTVASAASFAQSQQQNKPTAPTSTGNPLGPGIPLAPVGHRQPRAADVGQVQKTPAEIQEERQEAELERKLKICRGC